MDCDIDEAEEIGRAACRFTSVNGTLDKTNNGLIMVTFTGYRSNVKRAIKMIENKLKELRQRRTGFKPMHATVQGIGSVEVSMNHVPKCALRKCSMKKACSQVRL